ncbi:MAG: hypothetical protein IIY33_06515 [Erysipelotrichaceae bacterium]|nr:hypothetical protein [Erysipelotrichaceae bacterium]
MRFIEIRLTIVSFTIFCFAVFVFFSKKQRSTKRLLILTISLIIAIMLLEVCNGLMTEGNGLPTLLINIMQVFSLDADYRRAMNPEGLFTSSLLNSLVRIYRIVIYTVAPIIGGALIYDVLAGISPDLKLFFVKNRKLYIFSELNEKSRNLAKSISEHPEWFPKPVIVFTNCKSDSEESDMQELLNEIRELKAICIDDDIANNLILRKADNSYVFLISDEESGDFNDARNLRDLQSVLSPEFNGDAVSERNIFVFTNHADVVDSIRVIKKSNDKKEGNKSAHKIRLHVIRDYAHAANNLLSSHSPLKTLNYNDNQPLSILLIGNGLLAKEIYKAVFSQCQILNHPLELVVAYTPQQQNDDLTEFEAYLNNLNFEILESCTEKSEVLRQYCGKDEYSDPYARLAFIEEDLAGMNRKDFLSGKRVFKYGSDRTFELKDFNYFIVADDNDALNMELSKQLYRELKYLSMDKAGKKQVLAVYVEDSSIGNIQLMRESEWNASDSKLEMVHFGGVEERFSVTGVFTDKAIVLLDNYQDRDRKHYLPEFDATKDDIYNEWSNISREYHLPYKMFSAGCWEDLSGKTGKEAVEVSLKHKLDYCEAIENNKVLFDELTWLEHRRWNSFIRMQGFKQPARLYEVLDGIRNIPENEEIGTAWEKIKKNLGTWINFRNRDAGHPELDRRLDTIDKLQEMVNGVDNKPLINNLLKLREAIERKNEVSALVPYEHKDVKILIHSCLVESDVDEKPEKEKDMLTLVDRLRNIVSEINKADLKGIIESIEEDIKTLNNDDLPVLVNNIRREVVKEDRPRKPKPEAYKHLEPAHTIPRPCVIKNYDCPDGYNYPDLSIQEVYLYLLKELPDNVSFKKEWNKLLHKEGFKEELDKCANRDHVNRYYTDLVRNNIHEI